MATGDIADWYRGIPRITKIWFTGSVALPLAGRIGLVSPMSMILLYDAFVSQFQIWRAVTSVFYYPLSPQTGFHYLMNLYFLYSYSKELETGLFAGRPADYAFMLIFCWLATMIIALFFNIFLLMDPLIMAALYVWCNSNRDTIVQFWFGTQFKAIYLPWVLTGFRLLLGGSWTSELLGIVVGHLYFFLAFQYPQDFGGPRYLTTPGFLHRFFPPERGSVAGFGVPPTRRTAGGAGGAGGAAGAGTLFGAGNARQPEQPNDNRQQNPNAGARFGAGHNWGRGNQLGGR